MDKRIIVRAIVLHEGKLLCVQNKHYDRSGTDEPDVFWCLPGGNVEAGEALVPALEREIVEELGVKPEIGNLLYFHRFRVKDKERLEFFFHVRNATDYLDVNLAGTTHGTLEIGAVEFVDPAGSEFRVMPEFLITEDLAAQAAGAPAKIFDYV